MRLHNGLRTASQRVGDLSIQNGSPALLIICSITLIRNVTYSIMTISAVPPNFISEIFYLCDALGHYGYMRAIQIYENLGKTLDDYQRHHDMLRGDGSWMGVRTFPFNQIMPNPSTLRHPTKRACKRPLTMPRYASSRMYFRARHKCHEYSAKCPRSNPNSSHTAYSYSIPTSCSGIWDSRALSQRG